jgi:methyl-accepting chemotaxis protein
MKFFRKSFVTHKRFQYGFVLALGVFGGFLTLLNIWIQFYIAQRDPSKGALIAALTVAGVLVLVCLPIVLGSLIFTNRISGPLLRLKDHMEAAAKGEITSDFKFRDKDLIRDIEVPYNEILRIIRNSSPK